MCKTSRAVTAVLPIIASILLVAGCGSKPDEWHLPDAEKDASTAAKTAKVSVVPSVLTYKVEADFSNVEDGKTLSGLPAEHKKLLAKNGFLVSTCPKLDMYEIYEPNPAPFITADCVFHAYHVLLADTLSTLEEAVLAGKLESLVAGAHKGALDLRADVPAELAGPADDALAYWATAHRLIDPEAQLEPSVREAVIAEVDRIIEATFIGKLPGEERTRDYTVYRPIAGYERSEQMRRYFRCNRFLTLTPVKSETTEGAQTCALVTLALYSSKDAQSAYQDLRGLARFLAGEPEDVSPRDVLGVMRSLFGDSVSPLELADEGSANRLRDRLTRLKRPAIADQPQDRPGADPTLGWGLRVLSPGVSIRAQAFQQLGEQTIPPCGEHVLHLLGNEAVPLDEDQAKLLASARQAVDEAVTNYETGLDVHTSALVVLSKLSTPGGKGYPEFMNTRSWALKTANAQLGAWSQIEHDVFLYAKDTAYYLGMYDQDERFHGYVEPVPEYYAALAALVRRTRVVFENVKAFDKTKADKEEDRESPFGRHNIVATGKHYETLEEMLVKLKLMSEKELENRPFDKSEVELLKEFGLKLKYLAFNESNLPHAHEPMSSIVRIVREYLLREGLYVGTGRPLQILVIVPWQGKLHWCTGAIYSYYEFTHPLSDPITDWRWKAETFSAFVSHKHHPWLCRFDVGLKERTMSREALAEWLPAPMEMKYFGTSHGGGSVGRGYSAWRDARKPLDSLGFVKLDAEALAMAAKAFAEQYHREAVRCVLYVFLETAAADLRKATALQALSRIISEVKTGASADSCDYKLWIYLSLRLLKDQSEDLAVKAKILELKQQKDVDKVFKECRDDAELHVLLEAAGE